jgi:ribosome recycling factor
VTEQTLSQILKDAETRMGKAVEVARTTSPASAPGGPIPRCSPRSRRSTTALRRRSSSWPSFQIPEPRVVVVSAYDKNSVTAIEKAIRDSDLGVSPANDGNVLRLVLPELTQERRKEYVKLARSKAEDARVSVRSVRRSAKQTMDKMEKDGDVGKDDVTGAEKRLDGLTKKHTDVIDDLLKQKEAELLEL